MTRPQNSAVVSHPTAGCDNDASALRLEIAHPSAGKPSRNEATSGSSQRFKRMYRAPRSVLPIDRPLRPLRVGSSQLHVGEALISTMPMRRAGKPLTAQDIATVVEQPLAWPPA